MLKKVEEKFGSLNYFSYLCSVEGRLELRECSRKISPVHRKKFQSAVQK